VSEFGLVVIGASWGGLAAVSKIFAAMPGDFTLPIVLVQHRSKHSDDLLASLIQSVTQLRVVDVEDKEPLAPASVYIAPANYHLMVERGHLSLTTDPLVRFSRPSIDVTFASAADSYRSAAIGVVLTGANDDGRRGLRRIVDNGGKGIVQDPATAESKAMPASAAQAVPEAEVIPLEEIPTRLVLLAAQPKQQHEMRAG
jgi:two-component system, chemotaxis family, protein-glutamate methylesterase/glutaminase